MTQIRQIIHKVNKRQPLLFTLSYFKKSVDNILNFFCNAKIAVNELGHFILVVFTDCTYAGFSYPLGVYILRLFTLIPRPSARARNRFLSHTMHVNTDHQ